MTNHTKKHTLKSINRIFAGLVAFAVLAVVAANILVVKTSEPEMIDSPQACHYDADAIVVLGASVCADGTPSDALKGRLDRAIELYYLGVAPKILVSGDNQGDCYNESGSMKKYIVEEGIPSEDVFCDHEGYSTYESIWRARNVFGVDHAVIVTQSYHLPRAIYSALGLGMDARGVSANDGYYVDYKFFQFREVFARVKDLVQVHLQVPVSYANTISLNQSGDITN